MNETSALRGWTSENEWDDLSRGQTMCVYPSKLPHPTEWPMLAEFPVCVIRLEADGMFSEELVDRARESIGRWVTHDEMRKALASLLPNAVSDTPPKERP